MELLIALAFLAYICLSVWACFRWVLGPLDRAAKNQQCADQFYLADLLCLFVLVQLPVGIVHWATYHEKVKSSAIGLDVVFVVLAALVWATCVRTLSRAGIHAVWQRCVVLGAALPVTVAGSIAAFLLPFAVLDLLREQYDTSRDVYVLLGGVFVVGIVYVFGRFTRAIVASAVQE